MAKARTSVLVPNGEQSVASADHRRIDVTDRPPAPETAEKLSLGTDAMKSSAYIHNFPRENPNVIPDGLPRAGSVTGEPPAYAPVPYNVSPFAKTTVLKGATLYKPSQPSRHFSSRQHEIRNLTASPEAALRSRAGANIAERTSSSESQTLESNAAGHATPTPHNSPAASETGTSASKYAHRMSRGAEQAALTNSKVTNKRSARKEAGLAAHSQRLIFEGHTRGPRMLVPTATKAEIKRLKEENRKLRGDAVAAQTFKARGDGEGSLI